MTLQRFFYLLSCYYYLLSITVIHQMKPAQAQGKSHACHSLVNGPVLNEAQLKPALMKCQTGLLQGISHFFPTIYIPHVAQYTTYSSNESR